MTRPGKFSAEKAGIEPRGLPLSRRLGKRGVRDRLRDRWRGGGEWGRAGKREEERGREREKVGRCEFLFT